MSSGLYTHTSRATGTILTSAIYNADHQNHITNQNPTMTGALADSISQFQSVQDPGTIGSENLPTSLAGEIQCLRFAIRRLIAADQWYEDKGALATAGELAAVQASIPLLVTLTQVEYDALDPPNPNTYYFIVEGP